MWFMYTHTDLFYLEMQYEMQRPPPPMFYFFILFYCIGFDLVMW